MENDRTIGAKSFIRIYGARQHNLKNLTLEIPRHELVVVTGPSGSGKSSLAFDTLYAEGQRRYVESLSAYARQFLDQMQKPQVERIEGLSPAIAIEQRSAASNPRSTVATTTEIYDYLRLLFAHIGIPHCIHCHTPVMGQSPQKIADRINNFAPGLKLMILAPLVRGRKGEHREIIEKARRDGYTRIRIDGKIESLDNEFNLKKNEKHHLEIVVDRLVTGAMDSKRLGDSLERGLKSGDGLIVLLIETETDQWREELISERLSCPHCDYSLGEILPRNFSFNSPYGACGTCHGLGTIHDIDEELVIDPNKSLTGGAIPLWRSGPRRLILYQRNQLRGLAEEYQFSLEVPYRELPAAIRQVILYGSGDRAIRMRGWGRSATNTINKPFDGVIPILLNRYRHGESVRFKEQIRKVLIRKVCPECQGARLCRQSLAVAVNGISIYALSQMSIDDALKFIGQLSLNPEETMIARDILREISVRLDFLRAVGLGYLTLNRESGTLSGGEAQRIRLATQIGSGLTGVMYVLDEPSIGLHQRDNLMLLRMLKRLRDIGNSVIVVEHDLETITAADYIVDLGPGAGIKGGELIFAGPTAELKHCNNSLTAQYLSGKMKIELPGKRAKRTARELIIAGARENNLKNLTVKIPLGLFCCVTGVSGSGKSTLINDILVKALKRKLSAGKDIPGNFRELKGAEHVDKLIEVDQSPIGRTPRSNPATYVGVFDFIRELFARLPDARVRGYKPGRFSFNVKGGRCEECRGDGIKKIEMQFLPDVHVICESCKGLRYNRDTMMILYKGCSIADVLDMTVLEAVDLFKAIPKIARILSTLNDVGLGYIKLGQSAITLSGGEAQRVKLANELARPARGHTLYVLDEPTTGLHIDDVNKLVNVLIKLRDHGNTILVIEHNLELIKVCDHIIDLGPEGGPLGGKIVAQGVPEEIARCAASHTGHYLKSVL